MSNAADLTTLANVKQWLGLTGLAIAGVSNANPAIITLQSRQSNVPILNRASYTIQGITGTFLPDGSYVATVIDPTHFSIPVDTTTNGTYTGGGLVSIDDPLLARMITAVSTFIQSWLNRTIPAADYAETRNGTGGAILPLQNFPVLAVSSLTINGITIPPRPAFGSPATITFGTLGFCGPWGYSFDGSAIYVTGGIGGFARGFQNVAVAYSAGYQTQETQTIPATSPYTLTTQGRWSAGDRGVTYAADGTALTKVATPAVAGEYAETAGVYTFSAADAGVVVVLTYASVPWDIEQACIDTLGDWFKYINRIGKTSEAIEQQTTSFVNVPIPVRGQSILQQYKKVVPIGP